MCLLYSILYYNLDSTPPPSSFYLFINMSQRIRSTVDEREQKQLLMDLEVVMKSNECACIVQFYGALFKEGDCWICMELMDTSLDKLYKYVYEVLGRRVPESVLGKITVAVSKTAVFYFLDQPTLRDSK